MRPLRATFGDDDRPYFLWDEDLTVAEFRARLLVPGEERDRLLGKLLREANDRDVWRFVRPEDVAEALPRLERRIGARRYPFWMFLIGTWQRQGLVDVAE